MFYVKYRSDRGPQISAEGFDDLEDAECLATDLRGHGCTCVEILIDVATADQTARAMAFTPRPLKVAGAAGYGAWHGVRHKSA